MSDHSTYKPNPKAYQLAWINEALVITDKKNNLLYTIWQLIPDKIYTSLKVGEKLWHGQRIEVQGRDYRYDLGCGKNEVFIRGYFPTQEIMQEIIGRRDFQKEVFINYLSFEKNGDIVIRSKAEETLWSLSNTSKYKPNPNAHELAFNDHGDLVIIDNKGEVLFTVVRPARVIVSKNNGGNSFGQRVGDLNVNILQNSIIRLTNKEVNIWELYIGQFQDSPNFNFASNGDLQISGRVSNYQGYSSTNTTINLSEKTNYKPSGDDNNQLLLSKDELYIADKNRNLIYSIWKVKEWTASLIQAATILKVKQVLKSKDGNYTLVFQPDGNLVVYKGSFSWDGDSGVGTADWNSQTYGQKATSVCIIDGDLIIFGENNSVVWQLSTFSGYIPSLTAQQLKWDGDSLILADNQGNCIYKIY